MNHSLPIKTIGSYHYCPSHVVGTGSSSTVYAGQSTNNQKVCIKHILIKNELTRTFAKMEVEVLKAVAHPHVLTYLAHYQRGPSLYIVTERCDYTLLDLLRKDTKRDHLVVLNTFLQVLLGYEALRNLGYIHRDIKPENILIQDGRVKLADFGYCTLLDRYQLKATVNLGTPLYMAPEALSSSTYSQQSDIWSLGVTLFEMLTGTVPFNSTEESTLRIELRRPVKNVDVDRPSLNAILNRCLLYDPSERYDLQGLLLAVKLAINELSEDRKQRDRLAKAGRDRFIWSNELNYIRFLDHVKHLTRTASLSHDLRDNLLFLLEFQIRTRLHCLAQSGEIGNLPSRILDQYRTTKAEHEFQLEGPAELQQNSRIHFFCQQQAPFFRRSLLWQSQAVLKDLLGRLLSETIVNPHSQLSIALNETTLKLVDYLLTAFLLNKMLIESDNDLQDFAKRSHLQTILKAPARMDSSICLKIMGKAVRMNMI